MHDVSRDEPTLDTDPGLAAAIGTARTGAPAGKAESAPRARGWRWRATAGRGTGRPIAEGLSPVQRRQRMILAIAGGLTLLAVIGVGVGGGLLVSQRARAIAQAREAVTELQRVERELAAAKSLLTSAQARDRERSAAAAQCLADQAERDRLKSSVEAFAKQAASCEVVKQVVRARCPALATSADSGRAGRAADQS